MAQIIAYSKTAQAQTQGGDQRTAADIADDPAQMRPADPQDEHFQQQAHGQRRQSVPQASAEEVAEAGRAYAAGGDLSQLGLGRQGTDRFQLPPHFVQRIAALFNIPGKLIDRHHLAKLGGSDGDMLHLREGLGVFAPLLPAGGENTVAEHEKVPPLHAEIPADAVHGFLHPENFRAVFQKDVARLHGRFQHQPLVHTSGSRLMTHASPSPFPSR